MTSSGEKNIVFSDINLRCKICNAFVDSEDLFCSNCGAEAPEMGHEIESTAKFKHNYGCNGCGASMNYDANAQNLACPFCGNEKVVKEKSSSCAKPKWVIPFGISKELASRTLKSWMTKSFWRPSDLVTISNITKINAVYVPYWCFQATTMTYWTADSSDVPYSAKGDWRPLAGEHSDQYDGIMVGASSALTMHETLDICPFYLEACQPFEEFSFDNQLVELAKVPRKYARPQARLLLEQQEKNACRQYVPGRCRNMKVNVRLHSLEGRLILLPIWILTYRYKNQNYRFLVNGQTNKCTGEAPFSYWKLFAIVGGIAAFIAMAALIFAIGSAI